MSYVFNAGTAEEEEASNDTYDLEKVILKAFSPILYPCNRFIAIPDCISFSNSAKPMPGLDGTNRTSLNPTH